ncbi:Cation/acetate symporter ActP [Amycolatopsis sp. M39]|nr:Cation/acetate symporter ActP [Amycolatopsis sp. M39]
MSTLAASVEGSNPTLNILIFALFVVITLVIVFRASRNTKTASDYYAAGRAFTGPQNGIAISGDYLSAASFLGIAGAIAVYGYDGFLYSIGFLASWWRGWSRCCSWRNCCATPASSPWATCWRSG